MNILITSFTFPPQANGVANVVYEHAIRLMSRGHRVTILTGFDPLRRNQKFGEGIEIVQFKVWGNANIRSRYNGELDEYKKYIRSFRGDLICCHCWQIWSTDIAVSQFQHTPAKKVLISHGVSANSKIQWPRTIVAWVLWRPYVWLQMPKIIREFDHIVLLSSKTDLDRFYDNYLLQKLSYKEKSIIPNGIDINQFLKKSYSFRNRHSIYEKHMILSVGKFSSEKNEEMLVKSFIEAEIDNAILVLIGPKRNDYCIYLEELWKERKSNSQNKRMIVFSNITREEILSAYKDADIFINGSKTEYFPLVILEAMATRTPFISTDVGCVSELAGGVTVNSKREMTDKIIEIINNSELRIKLGEQGLKECKRKYSWERIIDKYERLFINLAN